MLTWLRNHLCCLRWATVGAAVGASMAAYAQDATLLPAPATADPMLVLIDQVMRLSPTAALVALAAWSLSRMGPPTVRVVLVEDEASVHERLADLERRLRDRE